MKYLAALGAIATLAACNPAAEKAATETTTEPAAKLNPAQQAYAGANARMHAGMGAAIDPDADVAFMQGMIPHHQGAVDMARVVLEHGKDPETRKLAEAVIASQSAEIVMMQAWLDKRGRKTVPAPGGPDTPVANEPVDHSKMDH